MNNVNMNNDVNVVLISKNFRIASTNTQAADAKAPGDIPGEAASAFVSAAL